MGSGSSAIRCTGMGAVFAGVVPFERLTLLEGVSAERDVGASVSGFWDMVAVLVIGRLTLCEGVADECEAEPLAVCPKGAEFVVEAEPAGRLADFEGVIEELEVEPFTIPFAGWSRVLNPAFVGVAFLDRCFDGVAE
jgi:hypothetical protein